MADGVRLALDLDGTLLDPKPRQTAVLEFVLGDAQLDAEALERWWALKREGADSEQALLELGLDPAAAAEAAARWRESVEERRWLERDVLLPGVARVLESLAARPPLVLTARAHPERVRTQFAALGLDRLCDDLVVVNPAEAAAAKARELRGRGAAAFVGDAESDLEAAGLAGVAFAGVSTGQRSRAYLEARGAAVFDSLAEAVEAVGSGRVR